LGIPLEESPSVSDSGILLILASVLPLIIIGMQLRKINRIKAHRTPKHAQFWCGKCDMDKVGVGEKCKVCGYRERKVDKP
jgi:hypothetical protein